VLKTLMSASQALQPPALTTRSCSERRTGSTGLAGRSVGFAFAAPNRSPSRDQEAKRCSVREAHGLVRASGVAVRQEEAAAEVEAGLAAFRTFAGQMGQALRPALGKIDLRPARKPVRQHGLALGIGHGAMALA